MTHLLLILLSSPIIVFAIILIVIMILTAAGALQDKKANYHVLSEHSLENINENSVVKRFKVHPTEEVINDNK